MLLLFSRSVMSDSLLPHGLLHAKLPYPSPSPRVCSNSCPFSQWCHPTISSSVTSLSSCFQSFSESGSFLMGWLFASGGKSTGVSFSFGIIPSKEYSGFISFRIDWFDLLAVEGTLQSLLQQHFKSISSSAVSLLYGSTLSYPYMTTGKTIALSYEPVSAKWCLCFLICCLGLS